MPEKFKEVFGNRIIGAKDREERVRAQKTLKEYFEKGEEEFTPYEIPKTERDKENIKQAINSVYDLIRDVGADPGEPFNEKRIHLLVRGGLWALTKGKYSGAFCNSDGHFMAIDKSSEVENRLDVGHELLHLKGKKRAAIEKGQRGRESAIQRSGLVIYSKEKREEKVTVYLGELEEGMIGLLNNLIFENDIKNNPFYAEELQMVERIKPWLDKAMEKRGGYNKKQREGSLRGLYTVIGAKEVVEFLESEKSEEEKIDYLWKITERSWKEPPRVKEERYKRTKELAADAERIYGENSDITKRYRKMVEKKEPELVMAERTSEFRELDKLVGEILEKSAGEFENRWQVLKMFAKAHFTGNFSPLRRKVEKILGKGSWEKIMEQFSQK